MDQRQSRIKDMLKTFIKCSGTQTEKEIYR